MSTPDPSAPMILYRRCRDGSLATVVRRKPHSLVSSASLSLMRPQLPALEEVDNAVTPLQNDRHLKFLFPYQQASQTDLSLRSGKSTKRKEEKQKAEDILPGSLSLRDISEGIVEHLELSRNHQEVVLRRRNTREPPLVFKPLSFSTQSVPQFPLSPPPFPREKRRTLELQNHSEALAALGFDDESRSKALRLRQLLLIQATPRAESITTEPSQASHSKSQMVSPVYQPPDEVSQFLQDQFQQKLAKGYFSKLRYTRDLKRDSLDMRTYRGLELI